MPFCFCIPKKKYKKDQAHTEEDEWSDEETESNKKNILCIVC